jgi:outer membrane protein assembly factor BamB
VGLLKKLLIFLPIFFFCLIGCSTSKLQVAAKIDNDPYPMFGADPSRSFNISQPIGHSLNLKWEASINGGFANSSVSIYDELVFLNDLSGRIYAFDLQSGKRAGLLKGDGPVHTTPIPHKFAIIFASAIADENKSTIYFYDYINNKLLHEIDVDGLIINEMIRMDDGIICITEKGKLYKYNFNGEQKWMFDSNKFTHTSPALEGNTVVFGNDDGELIAVNSENGLLKYRKKIGVSFFGSPSIENNIVFIGNDDGELLAIELTSGDIKWKTDLSNRIIMNPALKKDAVIIGTLKGDIFKIDKKSGEIIWKSETDGVFNASPIVAENIIIQPDMEKSLHFIDIEDGSILRTMVYEGRVRLSPVYFKNTLFIGYDNGILAAYEISD